MNATTLPRTDLHLPLGTDMSGAEIRLDFGPGQHVLIEGRHGSGKSHLLRRIGDVAEQTGVPVLDLSELYSMSQTEIDAAFHKTFSPSRHPDGRVGNPPPRTIVLIDNYDQAVAETGSKKAVALAQKRQMYVVHMLHAQRATVVVAAEEWPHDGLFGRLPRSAFATTVSLSSYGTARIVVGQEHLLQQVAS